jgi:membrane fusion protein (multidrug efflux system)
LIKERDVLTSLTDNSTMCAYFNVPEARYLEFMARQGRPNEGQEIKLVLANGAEFSHKGNLSAIEARFNVETGNIPFRADFPNPDGLLRHGQTGNILVRRTLHNVMVIPQRAVFDVLDKHYVWVVGDDDVAHRHEIQIQEEADESFVVKSGIGVEHKIVLEGGRLLGEGSKVDSTFRKQE